MKKSISIVITLLISLSISSGAGLATYKATYQKEMEAILLEHGIRTTQLSQTYAASLEAVIARVKKSGDLDNTKTAMAEAERFRKENSMPTTLSSLLPLKQQQMAYQTQQSVLSADKARKIVALATNYDQALDRLQRGFVSASKLHDAETIQTQRKAVKSSPEVTEAKALLRNASKASARAPAPIALPGKKAAVRIGTIGATGSTPQDVNAAAMVWQILPDHVRAGRYHLSVQHAASGMKGSFFLAAYADTTGDSMPDKLIGTSLKKTVSEPGKWSSWDFAAANSAKGLFVGVHFDKRNGSMMYYQNGALKGYSGLGSTVYYTRTEKALPTSKASPRYTNLRLEIPQ